jgi:hypothetical protein
LCIQISLLGGGAAYNPATGQGDRKLNVLKTFGPLFGVTFSK